MMHPKNWIERADTKWHHVRRRHLDVNSIVDALERATGSRITASTICSKGVKGLPLGHDAEGVLPDGSKNVLISLF